MANWKIFQDPSITVVFEETRNLLESLDLGAGKIFLSIEETTLADLEQIREFATLPNFFNCGEVMDLAALRAAFSRPPGEVLSFFLVGADTEYNRTIRLSRPSMRPNKGLLTVTGSAAASELAKGNLQAAKGSEKWELNLWFDSLEYVMPILEAAMDDFQNEFENGRKFGAVIYGDLDHISSLALTKAIRGSAELKGHLGFRPSLPVGTNIDEDRIPDLVARLAQLSQGQVRLSWQIVRLGSKSFESWNVLNIAQSLSQAGPASLEIYSLHSLPASLRKAIERQREERAED